MADLKEFLATLATDPSRLGEFIRDPEAAMVAEGLSEDDKAALKSGFPGIIHARLAGVSIDEAFKVTLRPPVSPQQFATPVGVTPERVPHYCGNDALCSTGTAASARP